MNPVHSELIARDFVNGVHAVQAIKFMIQLPHLPTIQLWTRFLESLGGIA